MNTLIIYDSQFGNTERIAQAIADTFRAFGQAQAVRVDPAHPIEFQGVDLLILGCPTQAFRPTPAMQSFLGNVSYASLSSLAIACFDTRVHGPFGSAARSMARKLQKIGVSPLLPPQSFFVKGTRGLWKAEKEGELPPGLGCFSTRQRHLILPCDDSRRETGAGRYS